MVLYITQSGAMVTQTQKRVCVRRKDTLLADVRLETLTRVVCVGGGIGFTGAALSALMEARVSVALVSSIGVFRGFLFPATGAKADRRIAQYAAHADTARRLTLAKALVRGKMRAQERLLARTARNRPASDPSERRETADGARLRIVRLYAALDIAQNTDVLMGVEGRAAAAYWEGFGALLSDTWARTWAGRNRRPARDPANALLSFAYTLLASESVAAVVGAGFDPAVGFLHALDRGRPSLALDVMEPFRVPVVDRLVLSFLNRNQASPTDFSPAANGGVRMSDGTRRAFLAAYETQMTRPLPNKKTGVPSDCLRERLRTEAQSLARACESDGEYHAWTPPAE